MNEQCEFDAAAIDTMLSSERNDTVPGLTVAIGQRGRTIYAGAFGRFAPGDTRELSPSSPMRVASITKQFTAVAFLRARKKQLASLDEPLGRFLSITGVAAQATIRSLLSHTSGLPDATLAEWLLSGPEAKFATRDIVSLYHDFSEFDYSPGSRFKYNNGGYALATAALERIFDDDFENLLQKKVIEPAEMIGTTVERTDHAEQHWAPLYRQTRTGLVRSFLGCELSGEGGLVSNALDLLLWLQHLRTQTVDALPVRYVLCRPQSLSNGATIPYGLGMQLRRYRGEPLSFHSGFLPGCEAHLVHLPTMDFDIALIANRSGLNTTALIVRLIDLLVPFHPAAPPPISLPFISGTYGSPASGRIAHFYERDGLQYVALDGLEIWLLSNAPGCFVSASPLSLLPRQFAYNANTQDEIIVTEPGHNETLLRLPAPDDDEARFIAGEYHSDVLRATLRFETAEQSPPEMFAQGRFGTQRYTLLNIARRTWRALSNSELPLGAMISFDERCSRLQLSTSRFGGVLFSRRKEQ